jgi:YHS domain
MKRLLACGTLLASAVLVSAVLAADKGDQEEPASARAALQALNDFIGEWKGTGGPPRAGAASKEVWTETLTWSWRFKGDDAWLVLDVKNGKHYKGGELRYLTDKKVYQLTLTDRDGKEQAFTGELKDDVLAFERVDPVTKETQQLKMNTAAEGIRLIYRYAHKAEGKTLYVTDYQVAANKAGESLGKTEKKNECVVSGGLGTIPVAYKGVTYYVCCSGCKDAFQENPEKYIKEYEARKAGKK